MSELAELIETPVVRDS